MLDWKKLGMYGIGFGIQKCYFADEDGAGGGGGDKGDDKGDKGDDKGGKKEDDKGGEQQYEVKIAGETKLLSLDELKEYATKAAGADARLREASDIRKEGLAGKEIKEAFEKVMKSDDVTEGDIRKLAGLIGLDGDALAVMFNEELEKTGKSKAKAKDTDKKIGRDLLDDDVRADMDWARKAQIKEAEQTIQNMCHKVVDEDKMFVKMISEAPDDKKEQIVEAVKRMVFRDVRAKILASPETGEAFGTEMIQSSLQGIRKDLKDFGIPTKSDKQPSPALRNLLAGLGPASGLPAEIQSDTKIERVPASDEANYEDNAVKRLAQTMLQGALLRG